MNEVVTAEIINEKITLEVKILQKQHEFMCEKKDFYI